MKQIINKLLNQPIKEQPVQISYYERYPLAQVHIDTMFYELTTEKKLIPIFIIVDVATRYTQAFIQARKNEKINDHVDEFVGVVRRRWKTSIKNDSHVTIISDGAKEFNVIKKYNKKISVSINKAAIAEAAIKKIRAKFRALETNDFLDAIVDKKSKQKHVDLEYIKLHLPKIILEINKTAKLRKQPKIVERIPKYSVGSIVFAKSKEKFDGAKLNKLLSKKSYKTNYDPEPLMVNKITEFNGISKYEVLSLNNYDSLKYYYYEEELIEVPNEISSKYIESYNSYFDNAKNSKLVINKVNWRKSKK